MKKGFDNEKYLKEQTSAILERVETFNNKLYLEFGGKLLFDYHAASSLITNACKHLAELPKNLHLLPQNITDSVTFLKKEILKGKMVSLDLEETLIALSISAISNPAAQLALENLEYMEGCAVHMTHMPTAGDQAGLRKLGVHLTSDPNFTSKALFLS